MAEIATDTETMTIEDVCTASGATERPSINIDGQFDVEALQDSIKVDKHSLVPNLKFQQALEDRIKRVKDMIDSAPCDGPDMRFE